jgi:succinylglutamic semialdehyde dehydrogenase
MIPNHPNGDQFLKSFVKATQGLLIGTYSATPQPFMGPTISHQQALQHLAAQDALKQLGGNALLTMSLLKENTGFLSPGIIDMTGIANPPDEEIFGPLVQIYRYDHFDEALTLANQTQYGLVAGLFSDNPDHYHAFYKTLRTGLINWNRPTTGALSSLPFGGIGKSGNHRPSAYFAADYCSYPIASLEQSEMTLPQEKCPGIELS